MPRKAKTQKLNKLVHKYDQFPASRTATDLIIKQSNKHLYSYSIADSSTHKKSNNDHSNINGESMFDSTVIEDSKLFLLRKLNDGVSSRDIGLSMNAIELTQILKRSMDMGENTSVLLLGVHGSGKTLVMNQVLRDLKNEYNPKGRSFLQVTLNGKVQQNDSIALKEICAQLRLETDFEAEKFGAHSTFEDRLQLLLTTVAQSARVNQPIFFVFFPRAIMETSPALQKRFISQCFKVMRVPLPAWLPDNNELNNLDFTEEAVLVKGLFMAKKYWNNSSCQRLIEMSIPLLVSGTMIESPSLSGFSTAFISNACSIVKSIGSFSHSQVLRFSRFLALFLIVRQPRILPAYTTSLLCCLEHLNQFTWISAEERKDERGQLVSIFKKIFLANPTLFEKAVSLISSNPHFYLNSAFIVASVQPVSSNITLEWVRAVLLDSKLSSLPSIALECYTPIITCLSHEDFASLVPLLSRFILRSPQYAIPISTALISNTRLDLSRYCESFLANLSPNLVSKDETLMNYTGNLIISLLHGCSEPHALNEITKFCISASSPSSSSLFLIASIFAELSSAHSASRATLEELSRTVLPFISKIFENSSNLDVKRQFLLAASKWFLVTLEVSSSWQNTLVSGLKHKNASMVSSFAKAIADLTSNASVVSTLKQPIIDGISNMAEPKDFVQRALRPAVIWSGIAISNMNVNEQKDFQWLENSVFTNETIILDSDFSECSVQIELISVILKHYSSFIDLDSNPLFIRSICLMYLHSCHLVSKQARKVIDSFIQSSNTLATSMIHSLTSLLFSWSPSSSSSLKSLINILTRRPPSNPQCYCNIALICCHPLISLPGISSLSSLRVSNPFADRCFDSVRAIWNHRFAFFKSKVDQWDIFSFDQNHFISFITSCDGLASSNENRKLTAIIFAIFESSKNPTISEALVSWSSKLICSSPIFSESKENLAISNSPIDSLYQTEVYLQAQLIQKKQKKPTGDWEVEYDKKKQLESKMAEEKQAIHDQNQIRQTIGQMSDEIHGALSLLDGLSIHSAFDALNTMQSIFPKLVQVNVFDIHSHTMKVVQTIISSVHLDYLLLPITIGYKIIWSFDIKSLIKSESDAFMLGEIVYDISQSLLIDKLLSPLAFTAVFPLLDTLVRLGCLEAKILQRTNMLLEIESVVSDDEDEEKNEVLLDEYAENLFGNVDIPSIMGLTSAFRLLIIHSQSSNALPVAPMVSLIMLAINDLPSLRHLLADSLRSLTAVLSLYDLEILLTSNSALSKDADIRIIVLRALALSRFEAFKASFEEIRRFKAVLFVLWHDSNETVSALAKELFIQKYAFVVDASLLDDLLELLQFKTEIIRENAGRAIVALCLSFPEFFTSTLNKLFQLFIDNPDQTIVSEFARSKQHVSRVNIRDGVACFVNSASAFIHLDIEKHLIPIFTFLVKFGLRDTCADIYNRFLAGGLTFVDIFGEVGLNQLLQFFENFLRTLAENSEEGDRVKVAVVLFLGHLTKHLPPDDINRLKSIMNHLINVLQTPSLAVQSSAAKCIVPIISLLKESAEEIMIRLFDRLSQGPSYGIRKGAAFGLAACVKGLKIPSIKKYGVMDKLSVFINSESSIARHGALLAYERLFAELGNRFEPYIVHILPHLLQCFGDSSDDVRDATLEASRTVMGNLSNPGVRMVLPLLLRALDNTNWRTKLESVRLLGTMSFCGPTQLSSCLPQAMPKILETLKNPNSKVQEATCQTLNDIGSVIQNPEIRSLAPTLLRALREPSQKMLVDALNLLSRTRFVHTVDPPSLAIIMPLLRLALKSSSAALKKNAAQISGLLINLVRDPQDLTFYSEGLARDFNVVIVDPSPDVRGFAAKSLGKLYSALGGKSFQGLPDRLLDRLRQAVSNVERSGIAHALAEVLSFEQLHHYLPIVFKEIKSKESTVREAFMAMLIYLPRAFGSEFGIYLREVMPIVLDGVSDESEPVREVSLRAGQVLVLMYAKAHTASLLNTFQSTIFDINWRIRDATVRLLGDFLHRLVGSIAPGIDYNRNEDAETSAPVDLEIAIERQLGTDRYLDVISSLFMMRSDTALQVRQSAWQVWKSLIAVTPRTLQQILPTLMDLIISSLASQFQERKHSASECLGELVSKMHDEVLPRIVPILHEEVVSDDAFTREGVCYGLKQILESTSKAHIGKYLPDLLPLIKRCLLDPEDSVRCAAASAFATLHRNIGMKAVREIVPTLVEKLDEEDSTFALNGLKEIAPCCADQAMDLVILPLISPPFTEFHADCLQALAPHFKGYLDPRLPDILRQFLNAVERELALPEDSRHITDATAEFILSLPQSSLGVILTQIIEKMDLDTGIATDTPPIRSACAYILSRFIDGYQYSFGQYVGYIIRGLVRLFYFADAFSNAAGCEALSTLFNTVPIETLPEHISFTRSCISRMTTGPDGRVNIELLTGFCYPKALLPFCQMFTQGLKFGSSDDKEAAALGFGDLIQFTSVEALNPYIHKYFCGPLILVLGDRSHGRVKSAILSTLRRMLLKIGPKMKIFFPQMQNSFFKLLQDGSMNVRSNAAKAFISLISLTPRFEAAATECLNITNKTTDDLYKASCFETLHGTLIEVGNKLSQNLLSSICHSAFLHSDTTNELLRIPTAKALGVAMILLEDSKKLFTRICSPDNSWKIRHFNSIALESAVSFDFKKTVSLCKLERAIVALSIDDNAVVRGVSASLCFIFLSNAKNPDILLVLSNLCEDPVKDIRSILDNFEEFVDRPKQTLLYTLFDLTQSPAAHVVIIGSTTELDVFNNLEKRVKSRFSHRRILFPHIKIDVLKRFFFCAFHIHEEFVNADPRRSDYKEALELAIIELQQSNQQLLSLFQMSVDIGQPLSFYVSLFGQVVSILHQLHPIPNIDDFTAVYNRMNVSYIDHSLASCSLPALVMLAACVRFVRQEKTEGVMHKSHLIGLETSPEEDRELERISTESRNRIKRFKGSECCSTLPSPSPLMPRVDSECCSTLPSPSPLMPRVDNPVIRFIYSSSSIPILPNSWITYNYSSHDEMDTFRTDLSKSDIVLFGKGCYKILDLGIVSIGFSIELIGIEPGVLLQSGSLSSIHVESSDEIKVRLSNVSISGGCLSSGGNSFLHIQDCEFFDANVGLQLLGKHSIVENTTIHHCTKLGVFIKKSAVLTHCNIHHCGAHFVNTKTPEVDVDSWKDLPLQPLEPLSPKRCASAVELEAAIPRSESTHSADAIIARRKRRKAKDVEDTFEGKDADDIAREEAAAAEALFKSIEGDVKSVTTDIHVHPALLFEPSTHLILSHCYIHDNPGHALQRLAPASVVAAASLSFHHGTHSIDSQTQALSETQTLSDNTFSNNLLCDENTCASTQICKSDFHETNETINISSISTNFDYSQASWAKPAEEQANSGGGCATQ